MEAIFERCSNYFMQLFDYGDVNFRMCKIREFLFRFVFLFFFTSASPRNFAINFYQWAPVCEKCENLDGRK